MDIGTADLDGTYEIEMLDVEGKTKFKLVDSDLHYVLPSTTHYFEEFQDPYTSPWEGHPMIPEGIVPTSYEIRPLTGLSSPWIRYDVDYDDGAFEDAELAFPGADNDWPMNDGMVRLYRNETGAMVFVREEHFNSDDLPFKKLPPCTLSKRTYRFCVTKLNPDGTKATVFTIDPDTNKPEHLPITYRFALYFP
jgi:hypothetical protein